MKTFNNELARKTDFEQGHCWSEIMDDVEVGDTVINGTGIVMLCSQATAWDDRNDGKNTSVTVNHTKADGTIHMGMRGIHYRCSKIYGWEKS
jgi:hypothetical protein